MLEEEEWFEADNTDTKFTILREFYCSVCCCYINKNTQVKNTKSQVVLTDKIKRNNKGNAASVDLAAYSSDDDDFLSKAAQVVDHNKMIAKELHQLERLSEFHELPFFLWKK